MLPAHHPPTPPGGRPATSPDKERTPRPHEVSDDDLPPGLAPIEDSDSDLDMLMPDWRRTTGARAPRASKKQTTAPATVVNKHWLLHAAAYRKGGEKQKEFAWRGEAINGMQEALGTAAAFSQPAAGAAAAAAPPPLPTPQLLTYTTPSFSALHDNLGVLVAGVQLNGLACVHVGGDTQTPLFDKPLLALQWLRMLLSAGAPVEFIPSTTIAGCVAQCRTRLRDDTVWDAAAGMGFGHRPALLHIRPNTPKSAQPSRLRQEKIDKGKVEVYATFATIEDLCLAAECALALAGGVEPDFGSDASLAVADEGGKPRLVAAHLPKDIFSVLGSECGSEDDADSISTSSAVSKLLHSDEDAEDCGDPAAEDPSESRIITARNPPLQLPLPSGPRPAAEQLVHPLKSIFIHQILYALYRDPIRVSSDAWTARLREEWACSRPAFERLAASNFRELNYEPALVHLTERGSAAYSFKQISFKGAVEGSLWVGIEKGLVSQELRNSYESQADGAVARVITIYIYLDAAGRLINGCKVTILYLIPLVYTAVGSLHVLVPVACHIGRFSKAQATAFWAWVAPDLQMLHHIALGSVRRPVRYVFGPDMAELWNSVVIRRGNIPWMTSDIQGPQWFGKGCSGYDDRSMHEALTRRMLLSDEQPSLLRYDVPPVFVGTSLAVPYLQAPVHRVIHTIGKMVAELACAYKMQGHLATAYHLIDCFPRTASWNPIPDAPVRSRKGVGRVEKDDADSTSEDGDAPAPEEAAEELQGAGSRVPSKKPAAAPRGKDGAFFLLLKGAWGGRAAERPQWTEAEPSPVMTKFRPNHEDVRGLLAQTPIVLEDGTTVEALWLDLVDFVKKTCLDRRILPEELPSLRTKGMRCLERWKQLCKLYRPWSPVWGGTVPRPAGGGDRGRPQRTVDGTGPLTEAVWFRTKCLPEQREPTMEAADAMEFDYPLCAIGPASIDALDHGTKTFEELTAAEAFAFTEQAGDHFFTYLYHTVPAVSARILKGKVNATTIWKIILEIWCAGYPAPGSATSRRGKLLSNSAYNHF